MIFMFPYVMRLFLTFRSSSLWQELQA